MVKQEIIDIIVQKSKDGWDTADILNYLVSKGYSLNDISEAIQAYKSGQYTTTSPQISSTNTSQYTQSTTSQSQTKDTPKYVSITDVERQVYDHTIPTTYIVKKETKPEIEIPIKEEKTEKPKKGIFKIKKEKTTEEPSITDKKKKKSTLIIIILIVLIIAMLFYLYVIDPFNLNLPGSKDIKTLIFGSNETTETIPDGNYTIPSTQPLAPPTNQPPTPPSLPNTGASGNQSTPPSLPNTGASGTQSTPPTLPNTGASGNQSTPPILPVPPTNQPPTPPDITLPELP